MRFLIVGDIIGEPGRKALKFMLEELREREKPDVVIVNVENIAGGFGITEKIYSYVKSMGVDVMTSGNHIWDRKEIFKFMDSAEILLRPANYPEGVPGRGYAVFEKRGVKYCVINLMGRVYLDCHLDNPFRTFDRIYEDIKDRVNIIVVDFHGEVTSEKWAFAIYSDGRASIIYGTHTHVPTADECILPKGTAYVTDVGMTGPWYSVIGMKVEKPINRFLYGLPQKYEVAGGDLIFNAVLVDVDEETGKAKNIRRIKRLIKREEMR